MLNKYVWGLYLESGGKDIIEMFRRNIEDKLTEEYADEIVKMHKIYCPMADVSNVIGNQIRDLIETYNSTNEAEIDEIDADNSSVVTSIEAFDGIYEMFQEELGNPADSFAEFAYALPYYSTELSIFFPDSFVPYYFLFNYNVLQKVAGIFDIELPKIPAKKDYKERFYHYPNICKALISFRDENALSTYELYAFLYDFAPKYVGGIESYIIKDLPEPHSAYFIGAPKEDELLCKAKDTVTSWQCSPDTRAGDMIVMYIRTPVSAINSIWRACSIGFIDPFFFYYRCVYLSSPIEIRPFTLAEIKKDRYFKELPIVRKNMQGINGVELKPSVYNHSVKLSKAKANMLEYVETESGGEYSREKDVEEKLIIPLLCKLGYSEDEFKRQMYVEIGNHNSTLIPDFVLMPDEQRGSTSGFAIIEAKRSIPNKKKLDDVMVQAKSYAKLLTAKYCVVAAQEKIWVTERRDNYETIIFKATWDQLNDTDIFYDLNKILGK